MAMVKTNVTPTGNTIKHALTQRFSLGGGCTQRSSSRVSSSGIMSGEVITGLLSKIKGNRISYRGHSPLYTSVAEPVM